MRNILLASLYVLLAGAQTKAQDGKLYYRCPKEFFRVGNKCYYLSKERTSWREANFKCQDLFNSSLAVLDKKIQDRNLRYKLNRKSNVSYERWIGGKYDSGRGVWVWGTTGKKIRYQAFSRRDSKDDFYWQCIVLDPQVRNRWGSRSCLQEKHFICEHPLEEVIVIDNPRTNRTFIQPTYSTAFTETTSSKKPRLKRFTCPEKHFLVGENCYHVSRDTLSWREANYKCGEMGSNLAVLDTAKLSHRLRFALNKRKKGLDESWIGGVYNWQRQVWVWGHTGCTVWDQNFIKNKTLINQINQGRGWYCIMVNPEVEYRWGASGCYEKKHYICERPANQLNLDTGPNGHLRQLSPQRRITSGMCNENNTL